MVEQLSPLGADFQRGRFAWAGSAPGVTLTEMAPGAIVQIAAWPGQEKSVLEAAWKTADLELSTKPGHGVVTKDASAFGIGPNKWLIASDDENLVSALQAAIPSQNGAVTDLTHGRTAIRISGPKAEWVLSKLFAVDFSARAFPVSHGVSTMHHEMFAQIQRTDANAFDIYVFRSFARSFWKALCHASAEVGYEVQ